MIISMIYIVNAKGLFKHWPVEVQG
jgi:hypothetical protein